MNRWTRVNCGATGIGGMVAAGMPMMPRGRFAQAHVASLADHEVIAEIEDTGPGIAPAIATRLFEPFVTHGKTHGTGLGLSICKRIIEDHGGRIGVTNKPGGGAVFVFSLRRQV